MIMYFTLQYAMNILGSDHPEDMVRTLTHEKPSSFETLWFQFSLY